MATALQEDLAEAKVRGLPIRQIDESTYKIPAQGVYIVKSEGFYKIGLTKNIENRIDSFETNSPFRSELIFFLKTGYPREVEKEIHQLMAHKRHKREWFSLTNEDILTIVRFVEEQWFKYEHD